MSADPRVRLVPVSLGGPFTAWRVVCLTCGYATRALGDSHAELVRRVHHHRHRMGYIGTTYVLRRLT